MTRTQAALPFPPLARPSACYDAGVPPRLALDKTDAKPAAKMSTSTDQRLQSLLEEYGFLLRHAIRSTLPNMSGIDLDDVLQDTRLRLWRMLRKETPIHNPRSFVYRVAVTAALDAIRRVTRRREEPLEKAEEGTSELPVRVESRLQEQAEQRQTLRAVRRCLGELGDNRRRAVALHLRGFKPDEIGRMLGWSESKARNLVYRGLRELRANLQREGIHYETP